MGWGLGAVFLKEGCAKRVEQGGLAQFIGTDNDVEPILDTVQACRAS